ncbi:unnamed protein product, partial [Bubo scandiacus]
YASFFFFMEKVKRTIIQDCCRHMATCSTAGSYVLWTRFGAVNMSSTQLISLSAVCPVIADPPLLPVSPHSISSPSALFLAVGCQPQKVKDRDRKRERQRAVASCSVNSSTMGIPPPLPSLTLLMWPVNYSWLVVEQLVCKIIVHHFVIPNPVFKSCIF